MFERLLIANRGEIACRVIASARRLGIATVAVYSDADRHALHVQMADRAVHIGAAPAARSYLLGERILKAARDTGAQAIHPGYGFLSENAAFARACEDAGIVFIGPPAAAIDAMGSKAQAKTIVAKAGVPLIPGYHGEDQSDDVLRRAAGSMGYPVLLKATAGGGGKGMRAVHSEREFDGALAAARREALASFGDERMLIEKLLQSPRHVEVQIFCDSHARGVYLSERDCSIQRRHQKVIEEAPAPGLSEPLRAAMGAAALNVARAVDYRGAGTVEFLLDREQTFYFMEMNTRLQVEHPVTEMITGQDLVEWQLRVAAGERLPLNQSQIRVRGHAIEARIYAEDPERDFLPCAGAIQYLRTPAQGPAVRIDTGVAQGSEISPHYDPMIAKLIVCGEDRAAARRQLMRALRDFRVTGPTSNIPFLYNIAASHGFASSDLDTRFIERHGEELFRSPAPQTQRDLAAAVIALHALRERSYRSDGDDRHSPWRAASAWRMNTPHRQHFDIRCHGQAYRPALIHSAEGWTLDIDSRSLRIAGALDDDRLSLELDGHRYRGTFARGRDRHTVFWEDGAVSFCEHKPEISSPSAAAGDAGFAAPMHGTVAALLVQPGTPVRAGDPVIVIEAMKMEHTLRAPTDGVVERFHVAPGDLVDRGVAMLGFREQAAT